QVSCATPCGGPIGWPNWPAKLANRVDIASVCSARSADWSTVCLASVSVAPVSSVAQAAMHATSVLVISDLGSMGGPSSSGMARRQDETGSADFHALFGL